MKKVLVFLLLAVLFGNGYAYKTPQTFMDLFFDFTGSNIPGFPANQKTISQILLNAEEQNNAIGINNKGPLILILNSSIYVYDEQRKLIYSKLMRTNPSSGFYEMTGVSHIGPAMSYLAKIKETGDSSWKPAMNQLLTHIKAAKALNTNVDWLKQAKIKPWKSHEGQIKAMFDYALSMSGNYIVSVLNGGDFNLQAVQSNFLAGNKAYPIPFNNVMVATFMLTALQSMDEIYNETKDKKIDWANSMVVIKFVAGANVTAGVTKGTNWLVPFLQALSNNTLASSRIIIAPYIAVKSDAGQTVLSQDSYNYYKSKWMNVQNREIIAANVFTSLETIYLPGRPALPGDYSYSKSGDILDFMVRLKHSFQDPREMLSNSVGFWMSGELASKKWDADKVRIPGLTDGFPKGISAYPTSNPSIGDLK